MTGIDAKDYAVNREVSNREALNRETLNRETLNREVSYRETPNRTKHLKIRTGEDYAANCNLR